MTFTWHDFSAVLLGIAALALLQTVLATENSRHKLKNWQFYAGGAAAAVGIIIAADLLRTDFGWLAVFTGHLYALLAVAGLLSREITRFRTLPRLLPWIHAGAIVVILAFVIADAAGSDLGFLYT